LRDDKVPEQCTFEPAQDTEATVKATEEPSNERDTTERSHPIVSLPHALRARNLHGDLTLKVEGYTVALTHLERVYWPAEGYRKGDLLRYYFTVAPTLLPYLQGRPLILKRHPNGITGQSFYQHDVDAVPDFVDTFSTAAESGKVVDYAVCNNLATLLYLVNLGTIAQNPWHSRVQSIDRPDWIVFDLDPHEVEFAAVQDLALGLKDVLDSLGLASYPKTSGASGMHVYVPIASLYRYEQVAQFAEVVARRVVEKYPQLGTLERSLKKRKGGRIYLDHLQNARGKSVVAPYAVRAQPGATVSTPLTWAEVEHPLRPGEFTLATLPQRLTQRGDLFAAVLAQKQDLRAAIEKLEDHFQRSHSATASKKRLRRAPTPKKKRSAGRKVTQSTTQSTRGKAARGGNKARH
jgi:bifunctional non-homologous end joining protein LigD